MINKYVIFIKKNQWGFRFIIFNLLIPHVHREGGVGQQARDAMLLCMSLSKKNDEVGLYIADHSNICPVSIAISFCFVKVYPQNYVKT